MRGIELSFTLVYWESRRWVQRRHLYFLLCLVHVPPLCLELISNPVNKAAFRGSNVLQTTKKKLHKREIHMLLQTRRDHADRRKISEFRPRPATNFVDNIGHLAFFHNFILNLNHTGCNHLL